MQLTTEQLSLISQEIIEGGIKYQDLYEELLDHYITSIEDRTEQGQTFGEAFGEVHGDFVNYKRPIDHYNVWKDYNGSVPEYGLGILQAEYEESLKGEISKRHWQIIKSYFRWPTIVTTILVGLLTFQFAYLVPKKLLHSALIFAAILPAIMLLPTITKDIWLYIVKKRKFINSLKFNTISKRVGFGFVWYYFFATIPRIFFDYNLMKQGHITVFALFICVYLAYSLSFYQLYRERFKVKVA